MSQEHLHGHAEQLIEELRRERTITEVNTLEECNSLKGAQISCPSQGFTLWCPSSSAVRANIVRHGVWHIWPACPVETIRNMLPSGDHADICAQTTRRPIIFIGHSLGGLIIKTVRRNHLPADSGNAKLIDFRLLFCQRATPKHTYQTEDTSRPPHMASCSWGHLTRVVKGLRGARWPGT